MSEMKADKNLLKPYGRREVKRIEFNEPIELFGSETRISVRGRKRQKRNYPIFLGFCKLLSLFLAFAAIFYIIFAVKTQISSNSDETTVGDKVAVATPSTSVENIDGEEVGDFVFLDESGEGIDIQAINTDAYSLVPLVKADSEVRIIILHSHSSERVSESMGVAALGAELCKRLNKAGIGAYHCTDKLDKNGVIGAYNNMKSSLSAIEKLYPNAVLIVDLHNCDVGDGMTLTVGADGGTGWRENLTLALALCRRMNAEDSCALRVLPSSIGQDNGLLSVHLGIGGEAQTSERARATLDAFIKALLELCER